MMDITENFQNSHLLRGSPKDGTFNCPNCGAPITDEKCPYCGTVFYDFTTLDLDETSYVKFKYKGKIFVCQARFTSIEVKQNPIYRTCFDADYSRCEIAWLPDMEMLLNFIIVPDKHGNQYVIIDEENTGKEC